MVFSYVLIQLFPLNPNPAANNNVFLSPKEAIRQPKVFLAALKVEALKLK